MLALIEITINITVFAGIVLAASLLGFLINRTRINKQRSTISKLEAEMLQNHAEILHLQKELSDKENLQSKTPVFSISDNAPESSKEQAPGTRLSKKIIGGGGKSAL